MKRIVKIHSQTFLARSLLRYFLRIVPKKAYRLEVTFEGAKLRKVANLQAAWNFVSLGPPLEVVSPPFDKPAEAASWLEGLTNEVIGTTSGKGIRRALWHLLLSKRRKFEVLEGTLDL